MQDNRLSEIIKTSLDGIKSFTDINTVVGKEITTPAGVTVIPVSKVTVGFANGGVDFITKKMPSNQNFGCGGGTGVSITPLAFLVIDSIGKVDLIPLSQNDTPAEKVLSLIDHAPEILSKLKSGLV